MLKRHHTAIGETLAQADLDAWTALMPGLHSFRESRVTGGENYFVSRFSEAKLRRADAARRQSLVSELPKYVLEVGFVVAIGGIAGALFAVYPADSALTALGVFAAASTRMLPTLNRVVASAGSMRAGRVGLSMIANEVEKLEGERSESVVQISGEALSAGDIEFREVSYRYRDSTEHVLEHLSTVIEEGRTTAIVGSSGAGKSTMLDIFLGLLEPTSGDVMYGRRSVFSNLEGWYSCIGVVPQDVFITDDTLRRNIAFGIDDSDIDDALVREVLELSQLTQTVVEFPDGVNTRMGERGVRLSGGQRQRVGIARALYRRPSILVLDEATSALDNATEERITETISRLAGTMTIVVVAHRLSTVRDADKIIFMSGGRIVSEGSFAEVEAQNSEFAHLVKLGRLA
jgi:ABC-type multidrug transport system fused ATPase/permease subunit